MGRPTGVTLDRGAVEAARRKRLLTVAELVRRSHASGRLVWRARTGQSISVRKARDLAKALRVPLQKLLADPVAPPPIVQRSDGNAVTAEAVIGAAFGEQNIGDKPDGGDGTNGSASA